MTTGAPRARTAALLLLAALAPGCGPGGEDDGRPTVGVSLLTQQHDFYRDLEQALRQAADERGLRLVLHSAEMDPVRQASQVQDFITQRVDAIVLCPCDSSGIAGSIRDANQAGIPVFTADIAAEASGVVCHVASDNLQGGRLAAATLAKLLQGQGDVVLLDHPEVASVQERVRGFEQEIARHPGLRVVDRPSAGGLRDRAFAITQNMLQAHPDLRGIFAINDDTALGALRAAGDASIVIVGYDATPEARRAIARGGPLKADVVQHPERIGRSVIGAVADHLAGRPVPARIAVEVGILDAAALEAGG